MKPWTASQRAVVLTVLGLFAIVLVVRIWRAPVRLADPIPAHGQRQTEITGRLDPNTADWPTLAVLPSIGPERARQIVAWREAWQQANPGKRAFNSPEDLAQIKGIGDATVRTLRPWLVFPEDNRD